MGFATVVGQAFFIIIFMVLFVQIYSIQHRQNQLQTELFDYQQAHLQKQQQTTLTIMQASYNTTWNTTNIEILNTGSTSFQINNSDLYIGNVKLSRNYTSRKFFACQYYPGYRCGELHFGDNANNEDTGLILLFHFNNDTQWSTTNGMLIEDYASVAVNELTANNMSQNNSGKFDKAYYFNGSNSWANRTNTAQNAFTNTTSYTWSFWINPTAYANPTSTVISKDAAATGYRIYLNSTGFITMQSTNGNARFNCTKAVPLNQWSHIAIVYTGALLGTAQFRCYINGTSIANQSAFSVFRSDAVSQFNLGRNASTTNDYFTGLIDELAVYNVAKTDNDIIALDRKGSYAGALTTFDPNEILEIDAYQTLQSGSYNIVYATQEGAYASSTITV